jgi:hypothetical protein
VSAVEHKATTHVLKKYKGAGLPPAPLRKLDHLSPDRRLHRRPAMPPTGGANIAMTFIHPTPSPIKPSLDNPPGDPVGVAGADTSTPTEEMEAAALVECEIAWRKHRGKRGEILAPDRQRPLKKRGRKKGSVVWTDAALILLACVIDDIKSMVRVIGGILAGDRELLDLFLKISISMMPGGAALRVILTEDRATTLRNYLPKGRRLARQTAPCLMRGEPPADYVGERVVLHLKPNPYTEERVVVYLKPNLHI